MSTIFIGAPSGSDLADATKNNPNARDLVQVPVGPEPRIKRDSSGSLQRLLRAATRVDHANLDRMLLRINLAVSQDYGFFLQVHHGVLQALEPCWRDADRDDFSGMLRAAELDIQALGIATVPFGPVAHTPLLLSHQWGIAYVVRGSRLGAQFLRRQVPAEFPTAYLDFTPPLTWPRFLEQLELIPDDPSRAIGAESILGAQVAFEIFTRMFTQALASAA